MGAAPNERLWVTIARIAGRDEGFLDCEATRPREADERQESRLSAQNDAVFLCRELRGRVFRIHVSV
jgi:hypothetical protein